MNTGKIQHERMSHLERTDLLAQVKTVASRLRVDCSLFINSIVFRSQEKQDI